MAEQITDLTQDTRVKHRFTQRLISVIEMNADGNWEVYEDCYDAVFILRGSMVISFKDEMVIFS